MGYFMPIYCVNQQIRLFDHDENKTSQNRISIGTVANDGTIYRACNEAHTLPWQPQHPCLVEKH